MSSSDDDAPLVARPLLKPAKLTTRVVSSDDDSPMPSWLANVKAPTGGVLAALSDSSDSDAKEVLSPPVSHKKPQEQQKANNSGVVLQPGQQKQQRAAGQRAPRSAGKPLPAGDASAGPGSQAAAAPSSQQQQQAAAGGTAQKKAAAGARGAGVGTGAAAREMPLLLPEKLAQAKLLVELQAGGDEAAHGATDLSGDSGAIGRLLIAGPPGDPQMQIDLKGVLYDATIVPCPVTLAVVNMGQTEAKVETLLTEFVQLREDTRFNVAADGNAALFDLGDDDDDAHFVDGEGPQEEASKGGKGRGGKKAAPGGGPKARRGAGGGKAGGGKAGGGKGRSSTAKHKSGGVKKPAAKPRKKPTAAKGGKK